MKSRFSYGKDIKIISKLYDKLTANRDKLAEESDDVEFDQPSSTDRIVARKAELGMLDDLLENISPALAVFDRSYDEFDIKV